MTATEIDALDLGQIAVIVESFATEDNQLAASVVTADEAAPPLIGEPSWEITAGDQMVTVYLTRENDGNAEQFVEHLADHIGSPAAEASVEAIDPAALSVVVLGDDAGPTMVIFSSTVVPEPVERRIDTIDSAEGLMSLGMLREVPLEVSAELGHARLSVAEILQLNVGSIIELDRAAGAPVDVVVNGALIARGEVVVIDEEYGVRITEVVARVGDSI